ncbi:MAG: NTP transferase domain-containing protein [Desulfobacteraceae bacterium]|jgi:bifunctional UDP-N-acetylglucosamine pyrophosphorylase/glucosamine-1-phosphate N-acetyltransferase
MTSQKIASLILAAGRGSRMKGFDGNKTLLPLIAEESPFEGNHPILLHIFNNLPPGPKALVVNYKKEDLIHATRSLDISYYEQPLLNGTGGALIAAREFLETQEFDRMIITMGDVPFVRSATYLNLAEGLEANNLMVLGFRPLDKKQYGVLEIESHNVKRIIEWEYWNTFPPERQRQLQICNSGIYAARKDDLVQYLGVLEQRPHAVKKQRGGKLVEVEEFFITDLVELMQDDGLKIGYALAQEEDEVMGIDDLPSLLRAQEIYKSLEIPPPPL